MTNSDKRMVEFVLWRFPEVCLFLQRRRYILEAGGSPHAAGLVDGGMFTPEQIIIMERKEGDREYMLLAAAVERVADAYREAPARIREVIDRLFFRRQVMAFAAGEMGRSKSTIQRWKEGALVYMFGACFPLYPVFRRFLG